MRSLLKSKKIIIPDQSVKSNRINGSDAETLAASLIVTACRGEVCWGSREEDNSKIDLILSLEHPWYPGERMLVLIQVKSGETYGVKNTEGFKLKTAAVKAAKRTSHSVCIIWICRESNQAFWAYIHPSSQVTPRDYSPYHRVSPATLYDLARCMSKDTTNSFGGSGVIIRRREGNLTNRRRLVCSVYKKKNKIFSPTLGVIELTRLGWRHMFRANRSASYKQSSLDLIPYLDKILSQTPTAHAITEYKEWESNNFIYRSTEHLLKYDRVMYSSKEKTERELAVVIVKALEEIRYPKNWQANAMLSQCIDRRVVLKSAYFKINSES
jgi:hypothetical protein